MKISFVITSIILFTQFSIASAHASLAVGDMARYAYTITGPSGMNQVFQESILVTAIDSSAGTYTKQVTVYQGGVQTRVDTSSDDLNSANNAGNTVDRCSQFPAGMATMETITVTAGTFQVCHVKENQNNVQGDQYFGKVPFGIVKASVTVPSSGVTTNFELIAVTQN